MKDYKILLVSFVLLIFMIGAVSAADVNSSDDAMATSDESAVGIDLPGIIIPDIPIGPSDDDDEPVDVEVTTKDIYVSDTGNDSNVGSKESPYATIKKAYSDVNASNDATIHIGEGTFFLEGTVFHYEEDYGDFVDEWDEEYNGLYIDLNHKSFGGNLKFIGAGADKTFLDGQSAYYFATIGSKANVTIKDVTFVNCKSMNGGTIDNMGTLTIDGCIFKDSYATGTQGGSITSTGSSGGLIIIGDDSEENNARLSVKNSQFISSSVNGYDEWAFEPQGGGAIYANSLAELYLENNTFINTRLAPQGGTGAAVYSTQTKTYLINNKFINLTGTNDASIFINPADSGDASKKSIISGNEFINCTTTSDSYSIVVLESGYHKFENNTFINSSNSVGNVFASGYVENLNFEIDDDVINISNSEINTGVKVPFNVTDDMGNIVTTSTFNFKFANENNSYTFSPSVRNGIATVRFSNVPDNGIYDLTIVYNNGQSTTDVLTIVNISTANDPTELYVSPSGSDADNGTEDSPFATIQHAIDVGFEKSFTVIVHLLKGTYSGEGNVELNIANKGNLKLIGEKYNETVIDGNNSSWFISVSTTNVVAENLTFMDGNSNKNLISGKSLYLKDCIVDNNSVRGSSRYIMYNVPFENLIYTNNKGTVYYGLIEEITLSNGYFANNNNSENKYGVLYIGTRNAIVENCTFINNTAKQYGAAIYASVSSLTSRNNWYEGNVAPEKAVIYAPEVNNYIYSFENDTFINNKATSGYYGVTGLLTTTNSRNTCPTLNFNDCKFINNSAVKGGAIGLIQGTIANSSFINNSADYGGAIIVPPYRVWAGTTFNNIIFDNVSFENNQAKNGNDIYLDENPGSGVFKTNLISLTIDFNSLNVSTLVDTLTVNITGPCGAVVGGGTIDFELNGTKIGTSEIINGVATFNYTGFEDGVYVFGGKTNYANEDSTFTNGTVIVKLEGIKDKVDYWVSVNGSDENGNGSQENPFNSISHAINEAVKNCRNINIFIGEGVYTGDLNTALELSSMNNLTLIGSGVEKTIIDGENTTYFATIPAGKNKVTVSDLTIKNMLPDNRVTRTIDESAPITIIEGGNLLLNNVEVIDNHGGNAIIVNGGNLIIDNAVFKRNGLTKYGIICGENDLGYTTEGGNVSISNTLFEDNYAYIHQRTTPLICANNLVINNSEIKNGYLMADNIYGLGFALINPESNAQGNVTIENTKISHDGSVEELNALGVNTEGKLVNPALDVNGNTYMNNCSMINNYNGTLNTDTQVASITWVSAFGYTYTVPRNVTVVNSSIINYQYLWMATTYNVHNFVFDGCVFENLDYIAWIRTNNPDSNYNITNSVFLNCSNVINQNHYAPMATPQHVNLNDNYWGSNDKPIVYFLDQDVIKDDVVAPDTWIILTSEDEQNVIKNLTDGENITAYTGNAPIRTDYADNNGALDYAVVFGPVGYLFTTDDDKNVIFNPEDAMYPFEAADPMDYRTPSVITITGLSGDLGIVGILVDPVGNPIANATIASFVNGENVANVTTDEDGAFTVKGIKNGVLTILFNGTVDYFDTEYNLTFANAGKTTKSFINLDTVESDLAIRGTLVDDEGNPIANATITYAVNGANATEVTTDDNGVFTVQGASDSIISIDFNGNDAFDASNINITLKNLSPVRQATLFNSSDFTQYSCDFYEGERGGNFTFQLVDEMGNPLANKTIYIGYNGVTLNRTTDENGFANVQINLKNAGLYTFVIVFLGDEDYNATMAVHKVTIEKKTTSISASAKTFKATAKTKKYTVTLKTIKGSSIDGKTYLAKGKKVTLTINGKTYTAKTNAKGQATFSLKITKKGKFTAKVSFAGDNTYKEANKSVKLTIK